jgi:hypothetical protein
MSVLDDGSSSVSVFGPEGTFICRDSSVSMRGPGGKERAAPGVLADRSLFLVLRDEYGKRIWKAPPDMEETK